MGIVFLFLGGLLAVGLIGFISSIAKSQDKKKDAHKEHYNYRLHTFSRIVYFTALMASFIMPVYLALHFSSAPNFLKLFFASPIFVFLMQNIMAHKLREHNISLHFIALCATMLSIGVIVYEEYEIINSPVMAASMPSGVIVYEEYEIINLISGNTSLILFFFYAFVGFYAFFAWMTALSNRNK